MIVGRNSAQRILQVWFPTLLKVANLGCVWFGDEVGFHLSVWDRMVPVFCLVGGYE